MPSARFTTMMTPKWTGSTPNFMATGSSSGASTTTEAEVSMNMPITNSAAFTPIRKVKWLSNSWLSHTPSASGMPARLSRKLKTPALAITNMMTAVEITERCRVVEMRPNDRRR
ncbi:Uncharacterised protein [Bordetella pertussis]|nr:Uncharacterised protein [Bordetella pertussis]CPN66909.1 Uncharacterised protein [Bordetella pertussis]